MALSLYFGALGGPCVIFWLLPLPSSRLRPSLLRMLLWPSAEGVLLVTMPLWLKKLINGDFCPGIIAWLSAAGSSVKNCKSTFWRLEVWCRTNFLHSPCKPRHVFTSRSLSLFVVARAVNLIDLDGNVTESFYVVWLHLPSHLCPHAFRKCPQWVPCFPHVGPWKT